MTLPPCTGLADRLPGGGSSTGGGSGSSSIITSSSLVLADPMLADLADADRTELQDAWLKLFGRRPPVRLSRELLARALSYQAQITRVDGFTATEREHLGIRAVDWIAGGPANDRQPSMADPTRSSSRSRKQGRSNPDTEAAQGRPHHSPRPSSGPSSGPSPGQSLRSSPRPVRRSIKPGTRLLREWQGQTHEVIAESTGQFLYHGKTYRSLSAIARAITGTRWSGPTFFGIATNSQAQKARGGGHA